MNMRLLYPFLLSQALFGNPINPKIVHGDATFHYGPNSLEIKTSSNCVIQWKGFSIALGETTRFVQPSVHSAVLNRVIGQSMTEIMGRLESNGKIYLINPNGIFIGPEGVVQTASLVASTLDCPLDDWLKGGNIRFSHPSNAAIVNLGTIQALQGNVVLLAHQIHHKGVIEATEEVVLATGNDISLHMDQREGLILFPSQKKGFIHLEGKIRINPYLAAINHQEEEVICVKENDRFLITDKPRITVDTQELIIDANSLIHTEEGKIKISAQGCECSGTIHTSDGTISIQAPEGFIQLAQSTISANGEQGGAIEILTEEGRLFSSGKIEAIGTEATGGSIILSGKEVVFAAAEIDVDGKSMGGSAFIGGGVKGENPNIPNASLVIANQFSKVSANSFDGDRGGTIVFFAADTMQSDASISAKGGFVEISGKSSCSFSPSSVEIGTGSLLLDPANIVIDATTGVFPQVLFSDPYPAGGGVFNSPVPLTDGNFVIGVPLRTPPGGRSQAGVVYLFNGTTTALIATIRGSSVMDQVGMYIIPLAKNNFVVVSPSYTNTVTSATNAGAVTFGTGSRGFAGSAINADNSLRGSNTNDQIGFDGFSPLVIALTNGNYVVGSPFWNGTIGAATFGNYLLGGATGSIHSGNSLIGANPGDRVGSVLTALNNGNYVVGSPAWNNSRGAATWGNGSTGTTGLVNAAGNKNILGPINPGRPSGTGTQIVALENGNYVVSSSTWYNTGAVSVGAVTWGNGTSGTNITVSDTNSLVGTLANDLNNVLITPLVNGNFVVSSTLWGASNNGFVTWGNGSTGAFGPSGFFGQINAGNSLVGATDDQVGQIITPLLNGHYVVGSPDWSSPSGSNNLQGAVTWANGFNGTTTGLVSSINSLIGSNPTDQIGSIITALTNGNYVVGSPSWFGGRGAATWRKGDGSSPNGAIISTLNSMIGQNPGDLVPGSITPLTGGNFLLGSPTWNNSLGAVTWGNGISGAYGPQSLLGAVVDSSNSLVGSSPNDRIGNKALALPNNGYVISSDFFNSMRGIAFKSDQPLAGTLNPANCFTGPSPGTFVGSSLYNLGNQSYLIKSNLGVSWSPNTNAIQGTVSDCNSVLTSSNIFSVIQNPAASQALILRYDNALIGVLYDSTIISATTAGNQTMSLSPCALNHLLQIGGSVSLSATSDITINSPIGNVTPALSKGLLSLSAGRNINFNAPILGGGVSVIAQANNDVTFNAAATCSFDTGNLAVSAGRSIEFFSDIFGGKGSLYFEANTNPLPNSFGARQAGKADLKVNRSSISTTQGSITFKLANGTGPASVGDLYFSKDAVISAVQGNILSIAANDLISSGRFTTLSGTLTFVTDNQNPSSAGTGGLNLTGTDFNMIPSSNRLLFYSAVPSQDTIPYPGPGYKINGVFYPNTMPSPGSVLNWTNYYKQFASAAAIKAAQDAAVEGSDLINRTIQEQERARNLQTMLALSVLPQPSLQNGQNAAFNEASNQLKLIQSTLEEYQGFNAKDFSLLLANLTNKTRTTFSLLYLTEDIYSIAKSINIKNTLSLPLKDAAGFLLSNLKSIKSYPLLSTADAIAVAVEKLPKVPGIAGTIAGVAANAWSFVSTIVNAACDDCMHKSIADSINKSISSHGTACWYSLCAGDAIADIVQLDLVTPVFRICAAFIESLARLVEGRPLNELKFREEERYGMAEKVLNDVQIADMKQMITFMNQQIYGTIQQQIAVLPEAERQRAEKTLAIQKAQLQIYENKLAIMEANNMMKTRDIEVTEINRQYDRSRGNSQEEFDAARTYREAQYQPYIADKIKAALSDEASSDYAKAVEEATKDDIPAWLKLQPDGKTKSPETLAAVPSTPPLLDQLNTREGFRDREAASGGLSRYGDTYGYSTLPSAPEERLPLRNLAQEAGETETIKREAKAYLSKFNTNTEQGRLNQTDFENDKKVEEIWKSEKEKLIAKNTALENALQEKLKYAKIDQNAHGLVDVQTELLNNQKENINLLNSTYEQDLANLKSGSTFAFSLNNLQEMQNQAERDQQILNSGPFNDAQLNLLNQRMPLQLMQATQDQQVKKNETLNNLKQSKTELEAQINAMETLLESSQKKFGDLAAEWFWFNTAIPGQARQQREADERFREFLQFKSIKDEIEKKKQDLDRLNSSIDSVQKSLPLTVDNYFGGGFNLIGTPGFKPPAQIGDMLANELRTKTDQKLQQIATVRSLMDEEQVLQNKRNEALQKRDFTEAQKVSIQILQLDRRIGNAQSSLLKMQHQEQLDQLEALNRKLIVEASSETLNEVLSQIPITNQNIMLVKLAYETAFRNPTPENLQIAKDKLTELMNTK